MGELSPGTTSRRWIPEEGMKKFRERIHKESKAADDHGKLPFKFSKPDKPKRTNEFACAGCGRVFSAAINTIMVICPGCKKLCEAKRIERND